MDPNLFHIDFERLMEVLITIVILSFFVERALLDMPTKLTTLRRFILTTLRRVA